MNNQWSRLLGYFVVITVLVTAGILIPMLGDGWLPQLISHEGRGIDELFWGLVILSIVILSIVLSIVGFSIKNFRAERGDESDGAPIHGNHKLELVWSAIPAVIVVTISLLSWIVLMDNEAKPSNGKSSATIFVRAFSFGWRFQYDDTYYSNKRLAALESSGKGPAVDLPEAGDLVMPINTTIRFQVLSCSGNETSVKTRVKDEYITVSNPCVRRYGEANKASRERTGDKRKQSGWIAGQEADVNHAFWVPEARLKIDAISGLPTWTQFTPTRITQLDEHPQVVCAELCGSGHNAMRVDTCVVPQGVFTWWKRHLKDTGYVTCQHLKYFTCVRSKSYDDIDESITKMLAAKPEATCRDMKEYA